LSDEWAQPSQSVVTGSKKSQLWVLLGSYDREGSDLLGVYSTERKAKNAQMRYQKCRYFDDYTIYPVTVDKDEGWKGDLE